MAVPFGGCTEPSKVKAGGQACPIRFQCSGCGFHRADPSYLPTIEDHINSLRADRESALAMDAASFVVDNLTAQITALRQERDRLREAVRRQLGRQLDQVGNQRLTARISELTDANRRLEQEIAQLQPLNERVDELEKDLAAARSSLCKMIRAENARPAYPSLRRGPDQQPSTLVRPLLGQ